MTTLASLLCVVLGVSGAGPLAEDPAFVEGMALYDQLEFEQAALRFEQAALDPDRTTSDRAQAFLWVGLSYANAGRFEVARAPLEKAFYEDAQVVVPPDQAPRIVELIEEARAVAAARRQKADTPPPPPPPAPAPAGPPVLLLAGAGVAGAGVLSLGASVVCAVLMAQALAVANDKEQFYEDAKAAQERANGFVTGAIVAGVLGVALTGGGAAMIAVDLME